MESLIFKGNVVENFNFYTFPHIDMDTFCRHWFVLTLAIQLCLVFNIDIDHSLFVLIQIRIMF